MTSYGYSGYYPVAQQRAPPHQLGRPAGQPGGMKVPAHVHHHDLDGVEMKIADKFQQASKVLASLGLTDIGQHKSQIANLEYSFDLERRVLEQNGDKRKKLSYN
ncbi:uncharacterized protein LOC135483904 [Lineus longissimus]|uniref:uncharacterized protein LOC135483904 n=1 Tax=Lineus longissimus TaxID=88925 RepID=UPI002B4CE996